MKTSTTLAALLGCAMLAACGGAEEANTSENMDANLMLNDTTALPTDNLAIDANNVTVVNGGDDMNAMDDLNATTTNNTANTANTM